MFAVFRRIRGSAHYPTPQHWQQHFANEARQVLGTLPQNEHDKRFVQLLALRFVSVLGSKWVSRVANNSSHPHYACFQGPSCLLYEHASAMFTKGVLLQCLFLWQFATALQLHQPRATPMNQLFPADGWTPKPTFAPNSPLELLRRQDDPGLCGYIEGDTAYPLYCDPGWNCMYDDVYSWFGCCTGTAIADCDVYTACVNSRSIKDCLSDSECYDNTLITGCVEEYAPYCATLYSVIGGSTYGHYGCASKKTSYAVLFTSSGEDESTFEVETETGIASFTGLSLSRSVAASTTEDGGVDSTVASSSSTEIALTSSGETIVETTRAAPTFIQSAAGSTTASSGKAERTTGMKFGLVGGVAGALGLFI